VKYLIVSKDIVSGTHNDDSGNMYEYFELGWETVGSRFDVIALYNQGKLNPNEVTIVTVKDRMFFYTKFYPSVIDYQHFLSLNIPEEDIIDDWTKDHTSLRFCSDPNFSDGNGRYIRHEEDKDLIFDGWDLENALEPDRPFLVLGIRWRAWCNNRNSDIFLFQKLLRKVRSRSRDLPMYVVGRGMEQFCEINSVAYVDKLRDFVSLVKNKNCLSLVSQSTGTALLALTCAETDVHIIDPTNASDIMGRNAVLGGKPVQFLTKDLNVYNIRETPTEAGFAHDGNVEYYSLIGKVLKKVEKCVKNRLTNNDM